MFSFLSSKFEYTQISKQILCKVELTFPMTTKEFKEEIPGALQEERKQHTGFMEKLREFFPSR